MELEKLRHEISHPHLNAMNPYMKDLAALYAARPTAKKALARLVDYYDALIPTLPSAEREAAETERAGLFREKIFS